MKEVKAVKQVWYATLQGAAVLGMATGILIAGAIIHCASASQSKTLTLSDEHTTGNEKVCIYQDASRTETINQQAWKTCKAVLVVDAG